MKIRLLIVIVALLVANSSTSSALCPAGCECSLMDTRMTCNSLGLTAIPSGYWPNTTFLDLQNNKISSFDEASLTGFPNLETLLMHENPLKIVDLNKLAGLTRLWQFGCFRCQLETIVPLEMGKKLWLQIFFTELNNLRAVPKNLLEGWEESMVTILLSRNPLALRGDAPVLVAKNLHHLQIGYVDAAAITKETFRELPNLKFLFIGTSGITNVSDTFTLLPNLKGLDLFKNPIKEIRKGFLSPEQSLDRLSLEGTQVEVLETGAINGILKEYLNIKNTPMACECKFEGLYWWAQMNGVTLEADCDDNPPCSFRRTEPQQ